MATIEGYNNRKQTFNNSCWAAVVNSVIEYMNNSHRWGYKEFIPEEDKMKGAIKILSDLYPVSEFPNAQNNFILDDKALPEFEEIKEQINKRNLFISNISWKYTRKNPDYKEGHWIAIIGYEETKDSKFLVIHDPNYDKLQNMTYPKTLQDGVTYNGSKIYFANTSYIDVYK
ncbi:MAG: papain-like cysteine protease family protein [Eubacteriales bacterium]|nr:papain-like cysteine protease family protein [Eubacteriales bacterium]